MKKSRNAKSSSLQFNSYELSTNRSHRPPKPSKNIKETASFIKQLLSEDKERIKSQFNQNTFTRDISFLKDPARKFSITIPNLPVDMKVLKKVHSSEAFSSSTQVFSPKMCVKEHTFDWVNRFPSINPNSMELGTPTGREDITHLLDWYSYMKETYLENYSDSLNEAKVILDICAKELVRQVSVYCLPRGKLLETLFEDFDHYSKTINLENTEEVKRMIIRENKYLKTIEEKNKENRKFSTEIKTEKKIIKNLEKKLHEMLVKNSKLNKKAEIEIRKSQGKAEQRNFSGQVEFRNQISEVNKEIQTDTLEESFSEEIEPEEHEDIVDETEEIPEKKEIFLSIENGICEININNERLDENDEYYEIFRDILDQEDQIKDLFKKIHSKELKLSEINLDMTTKLHLIKEIDLLTSTDENKIQETHKTIKKSLTLNPLAENELIVEGMDPASWDAGYNVGYDEGYMDGLAEGEALGLEEGETQGIKPQMYNETINPKSINIPIEEQSNSSLSDIESSASEDKIQVEKSGEVLEIGESSVRSLRRKSTLTRRFRRLYSHKRTLIGNHIFNEVLEKPLKRLIKKKSLSKRMLFKLIAVFYSTYSSKDEKQRLSQLLYDEFGKKYGLKTVADKKFSEFISSLYNFRRFRRASMFLQFLGGGLKIGLNNFLKESFKLTSQIWTAMANSKIGLMVAVDEFSEHLKYPLTRAVEIVSSLGVFKDKQEYERVVSKIESIKEQDPKRINSLGLVKMDSFLDCIIEEYEENMEKLKKNCEILYEGMTLGSEELMGKNELELLVKTFFSKEFKRFNFQDFSEYEIFNLEDFFAKVSDLNLTVDLENILGIYESEKYSIERLVELKEKYEGSDVLFLSVIKPRVEKLEKGEISLYSEVLKASIMIYTTYFLMNSD